MNKELLDQLPADEQPVAEKLSSAAETMKLSQSFQWNLETQLMNAYQSKTEGVGRNWLMKFLSPVGWAIVAIFGMLLLSWMLRSLLPGIQVAARPRPTQKVSFETDVRTGNVCVGPLALAHGFDVFLTNQDKTEFVTLDPGKTVGELRSFAWSADGKQLAILGNTTGRGNIYLTDSAGSPLQPVLSNSELDYLMDAAWSRDGKQFVVWSAQNNKLVYLLNADGTDLVEKQLDLQIFSAPQFAPDGKSIIFYGADASASGLFEVRLDDSQSRLINALVEDESAFAYSPDGSRLAYMAMDRTSGGAVLMIEDLETRAIVALPGSLPIPRGSGSSIPKVANLSWSADGKSLVFDFGRGANNRAIYLAHVDGTGLIKLADTAYAPAISADGKCLAYISDKKAFLMDLTGISSASPTPTPILLAELPAGRGIADYRLDKLQWRP
jgi:Tol biopolymer transport system component